MSYAIAVEGLSKQFRLGARQEGYQTLRDSVVKTLTAPIRRLRNGAGEGPEYVWALNDVSFEVKPGEAIGILGRNGAGKSTLLKILSRITGPTRGNAQIKGRLGSLLEVGTGFHPELTGRENILLNGTIMGMSRREILQKYDQIVDFAEIRKFIDTPVKRYSSGMYVRLAFAVAAHTEPDILLIDEVLSVGDSIFQRKCMEHAKKLRNRKATLLFVSHNMFSIKALCHRAVYLSGGKAVFDGSVERGIQLYEQDGQMAAAEWAAGKIGSDVSKYPIRIENIEVLDEKGAPRAVFDFGERMRLRIRYRTNTTLRDPNFNVSFVRSDNLPCCNFNMAMDNVGVPQVSGEGTVEIQTPPLKLVAELYTIHVMVWDKTFETLHCAQVGRTFHVRHPTLTTDFGIFHEPAEWSFESRAAG